MGKESFQPSGSEIAAPIPVSRVPGVPDGEGTQDGQLAARLDHLAHLFHLHDVAKVGEQGLVLGIYQASSSNFQWKIGALESISLDRCLEIFIPGGFPLKGGPHVGGGVPGDGTKPLTIPSSQNFPSFRYSHDEIMA